MTRTKALFNRLTLLLATMCVISVGAVQAAPSDAIQLSYTFEPGHRALWDISVEQEVNQTPPGQEAMTVKNTMAMTIAFEIKEVFEDGTACVSFTYDTVKVLVETPFGSLAFDSTDEDAQDSLETQAFRSLVGLSLDFTMTASGKILEIHGLDEVLANALDRMIGIDEATKASLSAQLEQFIGEDSMRESLRRFSGAYPTHPVAVGDTWTEEAELAAMAPIAVSMTSTLTSYNEQEAHLHVMGTMLTDPASPAMEMGPMSIRYDLNGSLEGDIILDRASGWNSYSSVTQIIDGQVTMLPSAMNPEEMSWPLSITSVISVSVR